MPLTNEGARRRRKRAGEKAAPSGKTTGTPEDRSGGPTRRRYDPPASGGEGLRSWLPHQLAVLQRLAFLPGAVVVAEVDALAEGRVSGAPELVEQAGPRVAEVLQLQLDEGRGAVVIVAGDLEAEAVRLVLGVADEGERGGGDHQVDQAEEQDDQRQGGDVRQLGEAEAGAVARDQPAGRAVDHPQAEQGQRRSHDDDL